MKRIILLGYGAMAKALAEGLLPYYYLVVSGRNARIAQLFVEDLQSRFADAKIESLALEDGKSIDVSDAILLLCVKPYALSSFEFKGSARAVLSILNAVSLEQLAESIVADSYVRAMPNICAKVGESITSLVGSFGAKENEDRELAESIFSTIGKTIWIEERQFASAVALGGCSPAFLSLVADSLIDSGVREGLTRMQSREIVMQLFKGFSKLLEENTPTDIKEAVMSPGGSTAQGIVSLEKNALRSAFFEAVSVSKRFA